MKQVQSWTDLRAVRVGVIKKKRKRCVSEVFIRYSDYHLP